MTEITITHRIEAPELSAAIVALADAIAGKMIQVPKTSVESPAVDPTPAPVMTQGTDVAKPDSTAAAGPVKDTPVKASTVESPSNQAPAKVYTFDDITAAGSQLLDQGKMAELMGLLKGYGVQAVTQLSPDQYASVAAGLRELGATI